MICDSEDDGPSQHDNNEIESKQAEKNEQIEVRVEFLDWCDLDKAPPAVLDFSADIVIAADVVIRMNQLM